MHCRVLLYHYVSRYSHIRIAYCAPFHTAITTNHWQLIPCIYIYNNSRVCVSLVNDNKPLKLGWLPRGSGLLLLFPCLRMYAITALRGRIQSHARRVQPSISALPTFASCYFSSAYLFHPGCPAARLDAASMQGTAGAKASHLRLYGRKCIGL